MRFEEERILSKGIKIARGEVKKEELEGGRRIKVGRIPRRWGIIAARRGDRGKETMKRWGRGKARRMAQGIYCL